LRTVGAQGQPEVSIVREFTDRADGAALATLRERLVMHPATLGQLLDRLARPARRPGRRALDDARLTWSAL
jgi:hypothetical protein